jgi:hypothetical protein
MIKLRLSFTGLYGRVKRGEGRTMAVAAGRAAVEQATTEWITRTGAESLSARMQPTAFATHGMSKRSEAYMKDQRRANGVAQPYASPRRLNWSRIAQIIARGDKADPQQLLRALAAIQRASTTPMRRLVVRPGGYRVRITGSTTVRATISLPGARALNRGGAKNEKYRRELLDLERGAGRDRAWIYRRAHQLMFRNFSQRPGANTPLRRLASGAA